MRAQAKTIAREAFQNEVEECVADTAKVWARRLYESRYTEPMTDKLVKAEVQSYIKEQMSHKEMPDLIQGTVQAAVAEYQDKTKQYACRSGKVSDERSCDGCDSERNRTSHSAGSP